MGAIASMSDFVNRSTGGSSGTPQPLRFHRVARIAGAAAPATIAGKMHSLWTYDGQPGAGVAPGAVAVPTRATAGALGQANPSGGRQLWLTNFGATPSVGGTLELYDRCLHISGLSGTVTTAQTVGGSLTRYTTAALAVGNLIMVEIYSAVGTTATTITASYTNESGTSGRTTTAIAVGGTGNREQTRAFLLPLQSGDRGVTAVASVTLAASTATAGNFGVSIVHPYGRVPVGYAAVGNDFGALTKGKGPQEVLTDACIAALWVAFGTTAPDIYFGDAQMIEA